MTKHLRPGHLSARSHVLTYVALAILIGVDYLLLSQSLLLLNSAMSTSGPIGVQIYVITVGFSTMMIALPHLAAILVRRLGDGLIGRRWLAAPWAIAGLWLVILVLVTMMRIVSSLHEQTGFVFEGLSAVESPAPAFDPLAPDSLMALLTALFLTATGLISFFVAWLTYRPLVTAVERAEAIVATARDERDRANAELVLATETIETAADNDERDEQRLELAKTTVSERLRQLRSQIATTIAEHDGDPEATSHMIRELEALRETRA